MCGIVAIFCDAPNVDLPHYAVTALDKIAHRGPDGRGMLFGAGGRLLCEDEHEEAAWALGHVRLAILDLTDTGKQPMITKDGSAALIYNGEVYNYLEIRKELQDLGVRFYGTSDSEVVLAAYRHWGGECVKRFNGMFAFVVADLASMRVFAARDRLGVKPLYVCRRQGKIILFSELKQLLAFPDFSPRTNSQQIVDFLVDGFLNHEPDQCCFDGVQPLPPGQSLSFSLLRPSDSSVHSTYWEPPIGEITHTWEKGVERTGELLRDAVRLRLRSDVPVGSCLSGGVDSSTIVGLAGRDFGLRMNTFSSCFPGAPFDERRYIDAVVSHCRAENTPVFPSGQGLIAELDMLALHQDEPFTSPSVYAQWCVMKSAASHGVRVILDGQGGDELLCGYKKYAFFHFLNLLRTGKVFVAAQHLWWLMMRGDRGLVNWRSGRRYLPAVLRTRQSGVEPLFHPSWRKLVRRVWSDGMNRGDALRNHQYADLTRWSLPLLLRYEDRNSMAHGVEARLPFLDYRLVEHFLNLKQSFFFQRGRTKRIVVEAVGDALPTVVRNRRTKVGFDVPVLRWLRGDLGRVLEDRVRRSKPLSEILDTRRAAAAFQDFREQKETIPHDLLFRLGSAALWLNTFKVSPHVN